jgi:hypothetical protein
VICFLLSFVSVMDNRVRSDGLFHGLCKGSILLESVMFSVLALIWDVSKVGNVSKEPLGPI